MFWACERVATNLRKHGRPKVANPSFSGGFQVYGGDKPCFPYQPHKMDRESSPSERLGTNRMADFPYRSNEMDREPQLTERLRIDRMAVDKESPH